MAPVSVWNDLVHRWLSLLTICPTSAHCAGPHADNTRRQQGRSREAWKMNESFSWVLSLSHVHLFATPWTAERQASLSIASSWCSPKLMSIESIDGHPAISSSVIPFSSYLQSFPASGSFQMSDFFESGGQSIGASVLPMNIRDSFPLGWTGWNSLQSKGLSRVFSNTTVQKHQFFSAQLSSQSTLTSIHDHWKNHSLD